MRLSDISLLGALHSLLCVAAMLSGTLQLLARKGTPTHARSGNAGLTCRLLSSSDLTRWVPLATNQIGTDGRVLFYDICDPGGTCRFYRLVMP